MALFLGCYSLLVLQADGPLVAAAVYMGILADLEGLAVSFVLPRWQTDVPTLFHALRLRRAVRA